MYIVTHNANQMTVFEIYTLGGIALIVRQIPGFQKLAGKIEKLATDLYFLDNKIQEEGLGWRRRDLLGLQLVLIAQVGNGKDIQTYLNLKMSGNFENTMNLHRWTRHTRSLWKLR